MINFIIDVLGKAYPGWIFKKVAILKNKIHSKYISSKLESSGGKIYFGEDAVIIGHEHIKIGENFQAFARIRMEAVSIYRTQKFTPSITVGNNVSINFDCHIAAIDRITIGNGVLIGSKVLIIDHSHGRSEERNSSTEPAMRQLYSKGPIVIEDNVWIGEGASILSGVTIGAGSIVGANTVVRKSIPACSLVVGDSVKVINK